MLQKCQAGNATEFTSTVSLLVSMRRLNRAFLVRRAAISIPVKFTRLIPAELDGYSASGARADKIPSLRL